MNLMRISLGICLIEGIFCLPQNDPPEGDESKNQNLPWKSIDGPPKLVDLGRPKGRSAIKLKDLTPENESTSIQDHFDEKLILAIQKIITDLISNPQTISFLLPLIPTFPPAAIIGSFVMVVLSIFQNPTIMNFMKNVLPDIQSLTSSPRGITIPKYLKDLENVHTNEFDFIKEGVKYATKRVDITSKELHLKDLDLNDLNSVNDSQHRVKINKSSNSARHKDGLAQFRKKRTLNQDYKDHKREKYQRNGVEGPIPLSELE